ncbi:hypothetical protein [Streptomyces sp. NPDC014894]|uniref:hypothetical protein n=1 Tax=unclassified Streptomyces TaxID=2593676 RepID=UPI0036FC12B8
MTRKLIRPRRLVINPDTVYMWTVRHKHSGEDGRWPDCRTILSLRREGTVPRLDLAFRAGHGRIVADGYAESGTVGDSEQNWLNLYEPGVVRRFAAEATERGLLPAPQGTAETDGWPLFDAITGARVG